MAEIHEETQYEPRDFSVKLAVFLGLGALATLLIITVGTKYVINYQLSEHRLIDAAPVPVFPEFDVRQRFPEPRLQLNPRNDMATYRAEQQKILSSFGWVDRTSDVARIPISTAMELYMARGISVEPALPPEDKDNRTKDGESQRAKLP